MKMIVLLLELEMIVLIEFFILICLTTNINFKLGVLISGEFITYYSLFCYVFLSFIHDMRLFIV